MPYVSIVLPCYNVQAYVRECLDSILTQSFRDIEVIGVDDASPDHSGVILDDYAQRDDRVGVIHLDENVGLGWARNAGLKQATGEYVLFVDSDDFLAPHALQAIADRLHDTRPDLLYFDYARAYWWGEKRRNANVDLFREPPAPEVFTLRERPSVHLMFQVAWNKVYRREFLNDLFAQGVHFPKGFYEDIPVSYPCLMTAQRITLLDRVCIYYRMRRGGGSILSTVDRRHFEVLGQVDRVFDFMERQGESVDWFWPAMFRRGLINELNIMKNPKLVPRDARREFFDSVADQYDRYLPAGFAPDRNEAWQFRLVARRGFRRYIARTWVIENARKTRRRLGRIKRKAGTAKRRVGQLVRMAKYRLHLRRPLDPTLALFASNGYRRPVANPFAIYRTLREHAPHIKGTWVVRYQAKEKVPEGIPYVIDGSAAYYRLLARAKYLVNNGAFPARVVKRSGQIHVWAQDGTPLETVGLDLQRYPTDLTKADFEEMLEASDRWDFALSSNRFSTEVWERAYPCAFKTLELGSPRNDRYFTADAEAVVGVRRRLGIPDGKTAFFYSPIWEREKEGPNLDVGHVARRLKHDQILVVRVPEEVSPELDPLRASGALLLVPRTEEIEDVCLAADALITDYSSMMVDFANLARPIILYAEDYERFARVRGLNLDLLAEPPGAVAVSEEELIEILRSRSFEAPEAEKRLEAFRARFCEWDDGRAGERVTRAVFLGEEPAQPGGLERRTRASLRGGVA